jgi:hypothetical protein
VSLVPALHPVYQVLAASLVFLVLLSRDTSGPLEVHTCTVEVRPSYTAMLGGEQTRPDVPVHPLAKPWALVHPFGEAFQGRALWDSGSARALGLDMVALVDLELWDAAHCGYQGGSVFEEGEWVAALVERWVMTLDLMSSAGLAGTLERHPFAMEGQPDPLAEEECCHPPT